MKVGSTGHRQDKRSGTFVKEKPHICLNFLTEGLSFADQFTPDVPIRSEILWKKIIPATEKTAKNLNGCWSSNILYEAAPICL